jgi:oligoribonuclease
MAECSSQNLVWIDLEMTGLIPEKDRILEIASIITDSQLNILAQGPVLVIHYKKNELPKMNQWVHDHHGQSGLLQAVETSSVSLEQAERETLDFIRTYCTPGDCPLCGNSVWQDRSFLRLQMPKLNDFLHYRIIDVTTIKELARRWYPHDPRADYKKKDTHRALDDIKESINELAHYRKSFFQK